MSDTNVKAIVYGTVFRFCTRLLWMLYKVVQKGWIKTVMDDKIKRKKQLQMMINDRKREEKYKQK